MFHVRLLRQRAGSADQSSIDSGSAKPNGRALVTKYP
jgi:hypothetical protein